MYPAKGEYFLVELEKKKYILKARKCKKDLIEATNGFDPEDSDSIKVSPEDVLCLLGTKPKYGNAYGVLVEVFRKKVETELGPFIFYCSPKKELVTEIEKAAKKTHKKLKKYGLLDFSYYVNYRVRYTKSDKVGGSYKTQKKINDILSLFVIPGNDYTYTLLHECAHGIWFRQVPDRYKGKWVKDYNKYIEIQHVKDGELKKLMVRLTDGSFDTFTALRKEVNAEGNELEKELIKYVVQYYKKYKRLDVDDLNCIMADGNFDLIKKTWPTKSVDLSHEKLCPISQYATKNVKEYFAEAFTLFILGKKLPKRTQKLMQRTLRTSTKMLENLSTPEEA